MINILTPAYTKFPLKDGAITWNDFERTKRFASVNRTYWPVCPYHQLNAIFLPAKTLTGSLSAASVIYYGHWYRRRPWSKLSFLLIAPIAYAVGTFPGAIAQVSNRLNWKEVQI